MIDPGLTLKDLVGIHTLTGWGMFTEGRDGSAADWVINDIRIGLNSQLAQGGDLPGDMFAPTAIDALVGMEMEIVQAGQVFQMIVTYVGSAPEGAPFLCSIVGRTEPEGRRVILPMSSGATAILPGQSAQITGRPQGSTFRPERIIIPNAESSAQHHLILRLDGVLHDFIKGAGVTRPDETAFDGEEQALTPMVVEFRSFGEGPMLWGVDEETSAIVLEIGTVVRTEEVVTREWSDEDEDEIGEDLIVEQVTRREHFCRFAPKGFVPVWWPLLEAAEGGDEVR